MHTIEIERDPTRVWVYEDNGNSVTICYQSRKEINEFIRKLVEARNKVWPFPST